MRDFDQVTLDVFPFQSKAFLWPESTIQQDGHHVAQQKRIARLDRSLSPLSRSYPVKGLLIRLENIQADPFGGFQVRLLFRKAQNAVSVCFPWNHSHTREGAFYFSPLRGKREHPTQNLKFAINGGNLHTSFLPAAGVLGNPFSSNRVKRFVGERRVFQEPCCTVFVVGERLCFTHERRPSKRQEIAIRELADSHRGRAITDANFSLGQRR